MSLVKDPQNIKLAMVGMVDGNGHPYSWSAIINGGYNAEKLKECPYAAIKDYMSKEKPENIGIDGAQVTHIWCDDPKEAEHVAATSLIPNVVTNATDVIGHVDAVVIPTDKGEEHLERARPFIEADIPVFIDKPLTIVRDHLDTFCDWVASGKAILSSSCMRYAREYQEARKHLDQLGELRWITMTTPKSWERYGIHALEGVYPFLEAGKWQWVEHSGVKESNIVTAQHASGAKVSLAAIADMYGAFGYLNLYGTQGSQSYRFEDTFYAFKTQLVAFIEYLRSGISTIPFEETAELMRIIIAGIESRESSGKRIQI